MLGFRFIFSFPIEGDVDDGDEGENGGGNGNGDGGGNGKGNREGETHLLTFMGFPFGDGKLGFQSGEELLGELRARDGLLEIFSAEVSRLLCTLSCDGSLPFDSGREREGTDESMNRGGRNKTDKKTPSQD